MLINIVRQLNSLIFSQTEEQNNIDLFTKPAISRTEDVLYNFHGIDFTSKSRSNSVSSSDSDEYVEDLHVTLPSRPRAPGFSAWGYFQVPNSTAAHLSMPRANLSAPQANAVPYYSDLKDEELIEEYKKLALISEKTENEALTAALNPDDVIDLAFIQIDPKHPSRADRQKAANYLCNYVASLSRSEELMIFIKALQNNLGNNRF